MVAIMCMWCSGARFLCVLKSNSDFNMHNQIPVKMGVEKTTCPTLLFHSLCQAYFLLHVTRVLFLHVAKFASLSFSLLLASSPLPVRQVGGGVARKCVIVPPLFWEIC
jgi:hypothetical protein